MTTTFAVDETNDLFLDSAGNIALSKDLQAVLENCAHAAKTIRGECVLDIEKGIPNFETIWTSSANLPQYDLAVLLALREVAGVVEVSEYESSFVGDVLQYRAKIITVYGEGRI